MGVHINIYHISGPLPRNVEILEHYITIQNAFGRWQFKCEDLGLTRDEVVAGVERMQAGEVIQEAFPTLSSDQRELFITDPKIWGDMSDSDE